MCLPIQKKSQKLRNFAQSISLVLNFSFTNIGHLIITVNVVHATPSRCGGELDAHVIYVECWSIHGNVFIIIAVDVPMNVARRTDWFSIYGQPSFVLVMDTDPR